MGWLKSIYIAWFISTDLNHSNPSQTPNIQGEQPPHMRRINTQIHARNLPNVAKAIRRRETRTQNLVQLKTLATKAIALPRAEQLRFVETHTLRQRNDKDITKYSQMLETNYTPSHQPHFFSQTQGLKNIIIFLKNKPKKSKRSWFFWYFWFKSFFPSKFLFLFLNMENPLQMKTKWFHMETKHVFFLLVFPKTPKPQNPKTPWNIDLDHIQIIHLE